ncbi:MAG: radical SAM family heme chaperone HemW [Bacteroidales bacterium]|nr:radical SAM family heme chaperone HemW [Bacteroidales bacterium]
MIYVHVPFCHRKCTYCAFYSRVARGERRVESYVDALLDEMELRKGEQAHPIRTVYFGGGTPSLLPVDELARVVEGLRRCFDLSQVEEVTLEANPEDLTPQYLADLASLRFFNRLSIGIQSLDDQALRLLNRRHTARQAVDAVENARRAGFGNISVDFIYGLPSDFQFSIFNFQLVTHVSAYALTVEPGTTLAVQVEQGRVSLPGEDEVVRQYHALHEAFEAAGFRQYEVSNYARPGFESRHNSRYWNRTPYLGLGPAAHSFDGRHRRWNVSSVEEYCKVLKDFRDLRDLRDLKDLFQQETLTEADAYNELLMTSLRTVRGLDLALVPEEYRERLHRQVQPYIDRGWLQLSTPHSPLSTLIPTPEGLLHADGMAAELFV